jgi:hypothetical protein
MNTFICHYNIIYLFISMMYADFANKACNVFTYRCKIYRFIDSKQTFRKKNYNLKHKSPLKQTVKNKELYE